MLVNLLKNTRKPIQSYCPTLYLVSVLTKLCNIKITNPVQYKTYNNRKKHERIKQKAYEMLD